MKKAIIIILFFIMSNLHSQTIDTTCYPNPDKDFYAGQKVYSLAEKKAMFIGEKEALNLYLIRNINYPKEQDTFQGGIYVTFIIDTLGFIKNECIYKHIFSEELTPIEKEVLRVIREMPQWIPAEQDGKKVNMRIILPLKF